MSLFGIVIPDSFILFILNGGENVIGLSLLSLRVAIHSNTQGAAADSKNRA